MPEADANERLDLTHEGVLALFKDKPFSFEPGSAWHYSNSAFYLAGMVVERVTKQDYGVYVREHLFKPLGMNSAQLCDARMVVPHLAFGYERDQGALVHAALMSWKLPWAAGAICATATDLLKWQAALDAGRVLSASSLKAMRTPTVLADSTSVDYGLGTRLGSLEGHRALGHTGGGGGFGNALESFPDDHLTVAVLINTEGAPALPLAASIARVILGLPENRPLLDLPVPKEELDGLVDATFTSEETTVQNFVRDGKIYYRDPSSGAEGKLLRQSKNVYAVNEDTQVHFVVREGRAIWGIVYTGGLMMDAVRRVP